MLDLSAIPIVDQHAHGLLRPEQLADFSYLAAFTEATAPEIVATQAAETLSVRRALREIGALLGCEPSLPAILAAREQLGFEATAARCFAASGVETILLDDGYESDRTMPLEWHTRFARVERIVRIESLAESLIGRTESLADFQESFRTALWRLPLTVRGLKSIVAYRTGLAVEPADQADLALAFAAHHQHAVQGHRPRLASPALNNWLLPAALEVAAVRRWPVQIHTGFGDPDLDLRQANPLHLRPLLEDFRFREVPLVLLHAAYPYTREAGYLASVYPNVHLDLGLAIPFLSVAGMRFAVRALLELTPLSKLLFSTDAHLLPELFYLGAQAGRRVLAGELEQAVADGDLTATEAEAAAEGILRENARRLYRLE